MTEQINTQIKGAVESLIFISDRPISIQEIQNVLEGIDAATIEAIVEELKGEYEKRSSGIRIVQVGGGYQMVTSTEYAQFIKKFYKIKHSEKLTMPALETLSIIAYKQPVTKLEIETIRGVNVDGVLKNLLEKGLIKIAGRKEVIGRPFVYATTRNFLEYFGLNSLDELPPIEQFVQTIQEKENLQSNANITPLEQDDIAIKENYTSSEEGVSGIRYKQDNTSTEINSNINEDKAVSQTIDASKELQKNSKENSNTE